MCIGLHALRFNFYYLKIILFNACFDNNNVKEYAIIKLKIAPREFVSINIITKNKGGDGAFREFADIILKAQNMI